MAAGAGPVGGRSIPASMCWRWIRGGPRFSTPAPEPACSRASTPGEAGFRPDLGRRQGSPGAAAAKAMSTRSWSTPPTASVVYAVAGTAAGHVSKSVDGGSTWRTLPASPSRVSALTIDPANPQVLFAAVEGAWTDGNGHSTIAMTSDGGATWRTVLSHDGNLWAIAVDPARPETVYAQGTAGVLVTADGGMTWQSAGTAPAHQPHRSCARPPRSGERSTSPLGKRVSSGQPTAGAPGPHSARPSAGRSRSTSGRRRLSTWAPRKGSRRPSTAGRHGARPTRASSRRPSSRQRPTPRDSSVVYAGTELWPVQERRPRSYVEGAQARTQRGGSRGSCQQCASARQWVTRDPHQHEQGPHLGEGSRQYDRPRQRDRVRPRSPGHRVRRRLGSRRDPKQRRWHHLAQNRTPPRMDRNDRRRPTRIRHALQQLQRCAPPQHRWRRLLELALLSHRRRSCRSTRNRSVRPADALRLDRRRLEQASPTASGKEHRRRQALAIPQVGHAPDRRHRSRHRAERPEHDVRSDTVPGRPADNRRRSHLATIQHEVSRHARSTRSPSTGPAARCTQAPTAPASCAFASTKHEGSRRRRT